MMSFSQENMSRRITLQTASNIMSYYSIQEEAQSMPCVRPKGYHRFTDNTQVHHTLMLSLVIAFASRRKGSDWQMSFFLHSCVQWNIWGWFWSLHDLLQSHLVTWDKYTEINVIEVIFEKDHDTWFSCVCHFFIVMKDINL